MDVESSLIEYGHGQFELTTNTAEGIRVADMAFIMKTAVKEILLCSQNNQSATFMTKTLPDERANGLHYNHSVFNLAGYNAFYNPEAADNLSDVARYWMANAGALTAICSPTVNCYRRLHQPWAPDCADRGIEDRKTSFRMKAKTEKRTYIENRLPGGSANPYLVLAAIVAAGCKTTVSWSKPSGSSL